MAQINSFRDLDVYKLALLQAKAIFMLTKSFPSEERYSLTDQVRRASRAVGALVAEAWGRRRYEAAFANKINEALSEAMETQAWLDHALHSGYLSEEKHRELDEQWQRIGGKLMRMEQRSASFARASG